MRQHLCLEVNWKTTKDVAYCFREELHWGPTSSGFPEDGPCLSKCCGPAPEQGHSWQRGPSHGELFGVCTLAYWGLWQRQRSHQLVYLPRGPAPQASPTQGCDPVCSQCQHSEDICCLSSGTKRAYQGLGGHHTPPLNSPQTGKLWDIWTVPCLNEGSQRQETAPWRWLASENGGQPCHSQSAFSKTSGHVL